MPRHVLTRRATADGEEASEQERETDRGQYVCGCCVGVPLQPVPGLPRLRGVLMIRMAMAGDRLLRPPGGGRALMSFGRLLEDLGLQNQRHRAELLDHGDDHANDETGNYR